MPTNFLPLFQTTHYTVVNKTITFLAQPAAVVKVYYAYNGTEGNHEEHAVESKDFTGLTDLTFVLTHTPTDLQVYADVPPLDGYTEFVSSDEDFTVGGFLADELAQLTYNNQTYLVQADAGGIITIPITHPDIDIGTIASFDITDSHGTVHHVSYYVITYYFYNSVDKKLYKVINNNTPLALTAANFTSNDAAFLDDVVVKISPSNKNTLWAFPIYTNRDTDTKVLKSTDGGASWSNYTLHSSDGVGRDGCAGCIHPTDPDTIWIPIRRNATAASNADEGIYKTTNGGTSWSLVLNTHKPREGDGVIVVAPDDASKLVFCHGSESVSGTNSGIYYSSDGGASWNKVISEGDGRHTGVCFDRNNNGNVYAFANHATFGRFIRKSTDYGVSWSTFQVPASDHLRLISNYDSLATSKIILMYRTSDGQIWNSTNGAVFAATAYNTNAYTAYGVSRGKPTLWLSVRSTDNDVYSSTDGANWSLRFSYADATYTPVSIAVV